VLKARQQAHGHTDKRKNFMKTPVVLITGASQGIGEAIAKVFAKEVRGVRLALVARNET
jgi:short-subunit dehydrogenase